jgi:hypothetical protein
MKQTYSIPLPPQQNPRVIKQGEQPKEFNKMKKQSKKHSIYETIANTIVGLAVSFLVQLIVYPMYGIKISHTTNLEITFIFFVVSFTRSYFLRRLFNNKV